MWHITNEDPLPGGDEEGGEGWSAWKCGTSQTRTHKLQGRKREEPVGELGNVARHKRGRTSWRGRRGRRGLVSLETWHVTNEDSHTGGEEEGGAGWSTWIRGTSQTRTHFLEDRKEEERVGELRNAARHKGGLTSWRGGRGRRGLVRLEKRYVAKEGSVPGGREEVGAR